MGLKKDAYIARINLVNHTVSGKILVFESDDWGSTRMPSKRVYNLLNQSHKLDECPYSRYDTLESESDCEMLADTLLSFKDRYGNNPFFSMNFLSANPDFEKIEKSGYSSYYFEPIEKTYKRYSYDSLIAIKQGIDNGVFGAGYHGREHLNASLWLDQLKREHKLREAAKHGLYMLSFANLPHLSEPYLATFYPHKEGYAKRHQESFEQGIKLFVNRFGKDPVSFVPPVYIWTDKLEELLRNSKIRSFQSLYKRIKYVDINNKILVKFSRKKDHMPLALLRNCHFEPSTNQNYPWIESVLREISIAFMLNKPAIISTHRLNYVGGISQQNRENNLRLLRELLTKVQRRWPSVTFLNTTQLLERIIS